MEINFQLKNVHPKNSIRFAGAASVRQQNNMKEMSHKMLHHHSNNYPAIKKIENKQDKKPSC